MKEIYFKGVKIIEFDDNSPVQLIGNNNYLLRVIVDIYYKVFNGYRFSDIDLEAMNEYYPEIRENGKTLNKNDIRVIRISNIEDILNQLTISKNSILFKYILTLNNELIVNKALVKVDQFITELSLILDGLIKERVSTERLGIRTEVSVIDLERIVKGFLEVNFVNKNEERVPLWLLKDSQIVDMFISVVKLILEDDRETRIIIDRMDSKIDLICYNALITELLNLTEQFSNLNILVVPGSKDGVLLDYKIFDNTYIVNDQIISLGDFQITYESICRNYPSNNIPSKQEVLRSLLRVFPFYSRKKTYLPTKEIVIVSIFLRLLGVEADIKLEKVDISKLEHKFLTKLNG